MIDPIPEKGPNPPIEVSSYEEFEEFANAGIKKDAEDLQEELKSKTPKKTTKRKTTKKSTNNISREPNAPKIERPKKKKTTTEE